MIRMVRCESAISSGSRISSFERIVTSAVDAATSEPLPMAIETLASARAGASLIPSPTMAVAPFDVGRLTPDGSDDWTVWTPFTYPFNLTGQPAATVPCGFVRGDRPVGLQVVGGMYQDHLVLRAAQAFQSARPQARHPEL